MNADEIYKIGQTLAPLRESANFVDWWPGSITHNLAELSWHNLQMYRSGPVHSGNAVVSKLTHQNYDAVLDWPSLPYVQRNHPTLNILPIIFAMGTGHRFSIVHSSFQWVHWAWIFIGLIKISYLLKGRSSSSHP